MRKAKSIMVQGTMSGAGKSLLCAGLCRVFAQEGLEVAPFKSQNMALNSYVTRDGLEMGRAQVVQAQAAGKEPDVRMNPILLKPSSDIGSQVIVGGEVRGQMSAAAYFREKRRLVPEILSAYESLAAENDVIVIEGAGSPAEINLREDDIVNMGLAELVDAPVLLAGDIDRGGVFAQLYGTVALLRPQERRRVKGLLINKFRGDEAILRPGLAMLEELTRIPVLGVVPYLRVDLDDEDSLAPRLEAQGERKALDVAVIRLPRISNFTDFSLLEEHPALGVRYVQSCRDLGVPDLVVLPGTKSTLADLLWLRQSGLEAAIQKLAWRRHPGAGGVRRLPDAGPQPGRPLGHRGGRRAPRHGAAACGHGVRRPKDPHPGPGPSHRTRPCRGPAGRVRDPHRQNHSGRGALLSAGKRPARRLREREYVRHLPPRPVRHRQPHPKAGGVPLREKGDHRGAGGARLPPGIPGAPAGSTGRGPAPGLGHGRGPRHFGRGAVRCSGA